MARRALVLFVTLSWVSAGGARADERQYIDQNTIELGGSLGILWFDNLFTLDISPSVGWFFLRSWQLTALLDYHYTNVKEPDGTRVGTTLIEFEIEPSYHYEIKAHWLYAIGGIGLGYGYDSQHSEFEINPRIGLNIQITRSGLLNPSILVPIRIGNITGPMNDELGGLVGFEFLVGYTTFF